jgi:mRNA-degrading endonuclease toxin of MazEF toxin-antitoxin module
VELFRQVRWWQNMNQFEFGEIFLVKFQPASGKEIKKYRPAVIINQVINQLDKRFTMIAPLTSDLSNKNDFEIIVKNESLKYESKILTWYIRTIDTGRLIEKIGVLSKKDIKNLKTNLSQLFKN